MSRIFIFAFGLLVWAYLAWDLLHSRTEPSELVQASRAALLVLEAGIDAPCYGGRPEQEAAAEALRRALAAVKAKGEG
jgi:hypothetical protein